MQILSKKVAAFAAVAALGVAGFAFAAPAQGRRHFGRGGELMQVLTDAQKVQAKAVFQEARQSAQPIRQQLMETRKSLRAAIQSGDTNQIHQLSATEGSQMGQLMAIRSTAFSKVYQTLTPEQKQKLTELQQERRQHRRQAAEAAKSAN